MGRGDGTGEYASIPSTEGCCITEQSVGSEGGSRKQYRVRREGQERFPEQSSAGQQRAAPQDHHHPGREGGRGSTLPDPPSHHAIADRELDAVHCALQAAVGDRRFRGLHFKRFEGNAEVPKWSVFQERSFAALTPGVTLVSVMSEDLFSPDLFIDVWNG